MRLGDFRFKKKDKLLKRVEFEQVFKKGKRYQGARLEFIFLSNELGRSRVGLVVAKKVGKATVRNKTKRILREVFRVKRKLLARDIDLIIRARPGLEPVTFHEVETEFLKFMESLSLLA